MRAPTAETAHTHALSYPGPRAAPGISTTEERSSVENLLLLCPSCHDYSVD
ncbi:HNH endonuclease [Nocardia grenadensis]|uniref:HNH endonuclease n=1 Tax=Nocardia grenadensis TaxID=931537 RepID=UPI003D8AF641